MNNFWNSILKLEFQTYSWVFMSPQHNLIGESEKIKWILKISPLTTSQKLNWLADIGTGLQVDFFYSVSCSMTFYSILIPKQPRCWCWLLVICCNNGCNWWQYSQNGLPEIYGHGNWFQNWPRQIHRSQNHAGASSLKYFCNVSKNNF